jgi:hypothetical protein
VNGETLVKVAAVAVVLTIPVVGVQAAWDAVASEDWSGLAAILWLAFWFGMVLMPVWEAAGRILRRGGGK